MYIQVYNTFSLFSTISLHVNKGIQYNQSVQYNLPLCTYRYMIQSVSLVHPPFMYMQEYNTISLYSTISLHVNKGIQYNQSVQFNLPLCTYRYMIQSVSTLQSPFMYIQVYNTISQYSTITLHVHTGI